MKPMGNRLRDELCKVASNYSEKDFVNDMEIFKKEVIDIGPGEETEWAEVISAIQEERAKKLGAWLMKF